MYSHVTVYKSQFITELKPLKAKVYSVLYLMSEVFSLVSFNWDWITDSMQICNKTFGLMFCSK